MRALGDLTGSLAALNGAVEHYPDAVVARLQRASALLQNGEKAAARADLDRIIERAADHWKAHNAFAIRATLRAEDGDHAGAAADMEQALALWPPPAPPEWVQFLDEIRSKMNPTNPKT